MLGGTNMKHELFFEKIEDDLYKLLTFEENIKEHTRPTLYNRHEIEYFENHFILALEEELVEAKDIIMHDEKEYSLYHKLVEFMENLLDEFYSLELKTNATP